MPTYEAKEEFRRDYQRLTHAQRAAFMAAVEKLVADLRRGIFRKGLRVKRVQTHADVWEMTWAPDGRATLSYGESIHAGDSHIIWRRIGGHEIFEHP